MVPIGSPLVVFCMTSIVFNIECVTVFEIFDAEVLLFRSRMVQGHPSSKVMVSVDSTWVISCLTATEFIIVSVTSLKYLTCNFEDLEPAQFKVVALNLRCETWPNQKRESTLCLKEFPPLNSVTLSYLN